MGVSQVPDNASPDNVTVGTAEVTAAGIARLAGVGRAAVSNWRRRHADFPKPVGGTETSPAFALHDIEQWLRDQGKLAEVPLRERVWQQLVGHPSGTAAALRQAGAVLLLVHERPAVWQQLRTAADDAELTGVLPAMLDAVLAARLGPEHPVRGLTREALAPSAALVRAAGDLAAADGAAEAYAFLLGRHLDANPRQYTLTPPGPAALMAELAASAGPLRTVLDPACGAGGLLTAAQERAGQEPGDGTDSDGTDGAEDAVSQADAPEGPVTLHGQEADPDLAALTALRLALRTPGVRVRAADTLRADAFPDLAADAVLVHPPFNERNWGHDELAYDPRWEYGFPARTESELAWVQHALARLRPGGTAVLLMPPAAASRRSGRRIRADLLRRGALRAVIALPAGAAPPNGVPLHLWVLRKPGGGRPPVPQLLVVDTADLATGTPAGRDKPDWQSVHDTAVEAWQTFDREGGIEERPGVRRSLAAIDLLDDDVDLAPARHLPPPTAAGGPAELARVRERLTATLARTTELTPRPAAGDTVPGPATARWPLTTVGELARSGALVLRAGGAGTASSELGDVPAVLTDHDVIGGGAPSGALPEAPASGPAEEPVLVHEGDVVVPVLGGGAIARVVDEATAGAALGRHLTLLRPDPAALDPWFLAGFLRGTANTRQASSYASTATRLDVRRLQLPRLALAEQRRYGQRFRDLAAFEEALRLASRLGEQLVQGLHDGLTDGSVAPD
ncbi:N-6 DNA methylase [Streptomyces sp. Isolate_219]|uniref:N-6 DNA methylase n=1 Tax=Streptomyces sp. Isolate_219 TaxID=2950110 RepID=UPI0021C657B5|nr:N-6 DNA methylase [Streptomyces sp. Isolate_219]MCR8579834.1 N-6 DNA methylase [Streptomyces sp. Isolate_219]